MNHQFSNKPFQANSLLDISTPLNSADGNYWCKNIHGEYFGVGKRFVKISGLATSDEINGKTDHQLPWADHAKHIIKNDCEVLRTQRMKIDEESILNAENEFFIFLVAKLPVYDVNNQLIGTIGCSTPIVKKNSNYLIDPNSFQENFSIAKMVNYSEHLITLSKHLYGLASIIHHRFNHYLRNNKIVLTIDDNTIPLTRREAQCLAYLFMGKSAKETAQLLNISSKTVESYLKNVKIKLNCFARSQIHEFIINNNLIYKLLNFINSDFF